MDAWKAQDGWMELLSYWDGLFSGAFAVKLREGKWLG